MIRILIEKELPLSLDTLLGKRTMHFRSQDHRCIGNAESILFMSGFATISVSSPLTRRLSPPASPLFKWNRTNRLGFSPQQIDAVLALRPQRLDDVKKRLGAVRAFASLPEAESLAATNKRVGNILKKADISIAGEVDAALLQAPAEQDLYHALSRIVPQAEKAFRDGDYSGILADTGRTEGPSGRFFRSRDGQYRG